MSHPFLLIFAGLIAIIVLIIWLDYRGLGRTELRWMFTTFHHSLYRPLTWVTFADIAGQR